MGLVINDFFAGTQRRPQFLIFTQTVAPYHVLGSIENGLCRAIVLFQHDDPGPRKIAFEALHILRAGPAPRINHLVVVTHYADVPQPLVPLVCTKSKQANQLVLRQVTILKLVHVEIGPTSLVLSQYLRFAPPQLLRHHQQIIKIHPVIAA